MANQFKSYSEDFCLQLMEHMSKGFSFFTFAGLIGIERETLLRWADKHEEFNSARKIGFEKALLHWETVMLNCANGKDRANASMIMFKMRNTFKEFYGDTTKIEHGGNIIISIDTGIDRPQIIEVKNEAKVVDDLEKLL